MSEQSHTLRTKADDFLDNMRALLAARPVERHRELIEANIAEWQRRHVEIQRWAAKDDGRPNPFAGWTSWSVETVIRELHAMKHLQAAE